MRYHKESRDSDSAVTGFLGEMFGAIQAVKVADAETAAMHYLETLSERAAQAQRAPGHLFGPGLLRRRQHGRCGRGGDGALGGRCDVARHLHRG